MTNVTAKGTLKAKTLGGSMKLFKEMAINSYQWYSFNTKPSRPAQVYDMDAIVVSKIQVEALNIKIWVASDTIDNSSEAM